MEANYKIWIDEAGVIKAIRMSDEPHSLTYTEALSKAKIEAVTFKDKGWDLTSLRDHLFRRDGELKNDTIHDIPEGYSVEVEDVGTCKALTTFSEYCFCNDGCKDFVAVLKKTSPPLPVNTEDEKGVDQKEEKDRLKREFNLVTYGAVSDYDRKKIWNFFYSEIEKRQNFKDYVHKRLDDAGVPVDPDSPHKEHGCRIGGRLDFVFEELASLRKAMEAADEVILLKFLDWYDGDLKVLKDHKQLINEYFEDSQQK